MQMMNMMYMNMGMMQPYQQMMMMNMMQNMNQFQTPGSYQKGNKNNMFVRRAKEKTGGNAKRRGPNRRRGGNNQYERKSNYNNDGTARDNNKPQPKKARVRLDSDNFPSLPDRQILARAK